MLHSVPVFPQIPTVKCVVFQDPGSSTGEPYTAYQDSWSIMGNGLDFPEMDKVKLGWIADYEQTAVTNKARTITKEEVFSLYPTVRASACTAVARSPRVCPACLAISR